MNDLGQLSTLPKPNNGVRIKDRAEGRTVACVLLTLELALVLVHHLVFSDQDFGCDFQAHHTWI